jgi:hypothetical protein
VCNEAPPLLVIGPGQSHAALEARGLNFRLAKNNRCKLFFRINPTKSNSLAGYFRLNWSSLCMLLRGTGC